MSMQPSDPSGEDPFSRPKPIERIIEIDATLSAERRPSRDPADEPARLRAEQAIDRRDAHDPNRYNRLERTALLQIILDSVPAIIWYYDVQGQQFVNRAFNEFTGLTPAQLCGERLQTLIHPADAEAYNHCLATGMQARKPFQVRVRLRRADEHWRWVVSQGRPCHSADGEYLGYVGTVIDITPRRMLEQELHAKAARLPEVEEALQQSEITYRAILQHLPDGAVIVFDRHLRIHVADGRGLAAVGWSRESLEGKALAELDEETRALMEPYARRVVDGEPIDCEVCYRGRIIRGCGVPIHYDQQDEPKRVLWAVAIFQDLTRLRTAEARLAKTSAQPEQVAQDTQAATQSAVAKNLEKKSAEQPVPAVKTTPQGMNQGAEKAVQERTSELTRTIEALRRETAQRAQTQAQLKKANEQLTLQAGRLKELVGEITLAEQRERARISKILHAGLLQHLASAGTQLDGVAGQLVDADLQRRCQAIRAVLDESIKLSHSLSLDLSPLELVQNGLFKALEWLAQQMRRRFDFEVVLKGETAPALPAQIALTAFEAVRELLFNCVRHSGVSRAQVDLQIAHDPWIRIIVRDQGAGFDPRQLKTAGARTEGAGLFSIHVRLGLIGGQFLIESRPGKGSRFTLLLPKPNPSAVPAPADQTQ